MVNDDNLEKGYQVNQKPLNDDTNVTMPDAYDPEALNKLLDFSVNNLDLVELDNLINSFNPLKILGVSEHEIRHSNVLAWLFDPQGHHGLGDTLFKNFLLEILKDSKKGDTIGNLPLIQDVLIANFNDLRVLREYKNIDILAISPSHKVVVVIENKVNATESDKQLTKYADIVDKKYHGYNKVFVLLTLDGITPKGNDRYFSFSHEQIHDIVWSVTEVRKDYMHSKVYDFICQYLQVLGEKVTMQNTDFIEICSRLYKQHGDAIKMILEHGRPKLPNANIKDFHERTDTESFQSDKVSVPVYYPFIPKSWSDIVPFTNQDQEKYLVYVYLLLNEYENQKAFMHIRVGNFPDQEERERFLTQLRQAAEADKNSNLTVKLAKQKGTTVFSQSISLKRWKDEDCELDDYETITNILEDAYNDTKMQQALTIVGDVVKDFWGKE